MVIQAVVDEGDGEPGSQCLSVCEHVRHSFLPASSLPDCLGHAHVLLAAFERVRRSLRSHLNAVGS